MDLHALIDHLAAYDLWANTLFVKRLGTEPDEFLDRSVKSSFPSLRLTVMHIRDAEAAWLCRLTGAPVRWPADQAVSLTNLLTHSARLRDHVAALRPAQLEKIHAYRDLRGNMHQQPSWQMLLHAFNHSTYHRGQLVTMMRTLDMDEIPHSDLVVFQRSLKATT